MLNWLKVFLAIPGENYLLRKNDARPTNSQQRDVKPNLTVMQLSRYFILGETVGQELKSKYFVGIRTQGQFSIFPN